MKNNEGFYMSLFINNRAIMLLIDPETSKIVDCNRSASSFYGYSYLEMLKLKITDINSLPEPQVVKEMTLAKVEESNHFYFKHRLFNGQIRDVEVNSTPIISEGRNLLSSIIWDITNCNINSNKLKVEKCNLEKVVAERTYQLEEANETSTLASTTVKPLKALVSLTASNVYQIRSFTKLLLNHLFLLKSEGKRA